MAKVTKKPDRTVYVRVSDRTYARISDEVHRRRKNRDAFASKQAIISYLIDQYLAGEVEIPRENAA